MVSRVVMELPTLRSTLYRLIGPLRLLLLLRVILLLVLNLPPVRGRGLVVPVVPLLLVTVVTLVGLLLLVSIRLVMALLISQRIPRKSNKIVALRVSQNVASTKLERRHITPIP
jgi:hypothetical protein